MWPEGIANNRDTPERGTRGHTTDLVEDEREHGSSRRVGSCDCFPFQEEEGNIPDLTVSRSREIPWGGCWCHSPRLAHGSLACLGVTVPGHRASQPRYPPASPGQAAAAPFPTLAPPELLLSLWKHLALGRTARTDASWPYFLMKERARRKGALPPRPPHTHTRWNTCPFCTLAQVGSIWSQLGRCWWGSPARCSLGCR